AFGQADTKLGCVDRRVRARREQPPPVGRTGARDGVVGCVLAAAEAVEDQKNDGPHGGLRGQGLGGGRGGGSERFHANEARGRASGVVPYAIILSFAESSHPMLLPFLEKNWPLVLVFLLSGAMLLWPLLQRRLSPVREIGTLDATRLINSGNPIVLDVREPREFVGGRLPNAMHVPLSQ